MKTIITATYQKKNGQWSRMDWPKNVPLARIGDHVMLHDTGTLKVAAVLFTIYSDWTDINISLTDPFNPSPVDNQ